MVNHHETTIWENSFFYFRASLANPMLNEGLAMSLRIGRSLPPICTFQSSKGKVDTFGRVRKMNTTMYT